jgi:hypothetical protein
MLAVLVSKPLTSGVFHAADAEILRHDVVHNYGAGATVSCGGHDAVAWSVALLMGLCARV